jgi:hypothetical protein
MNQPIPNRFPVEENQLTENQPKGHGFKVSEINWRGVLILFLVLLAFIIVPPAIFGLSDLAGQIGSTITRWYSGASIYPSDTKGFTSFVALSLFGLFIYSIFSVIKPKK